MKLNRSQLQRKLDSLARAQNRAFRARETIIEHCVAVYGVTPGEVDNDQFIDACDGGNGVASGMSVDEFDRSMRECAERESKGCI